MIIAGIACILAGVRGDKPEEIAAEGGAASGKQPVSGSDVESGGAAGGEQQPGRFARVKSDAMAAVTSMKSGLTSAVTSL